MQSMVITMKRVVCRDDATQPVQISDSGALPLPFFIWWGCVGERGGVACGFDGFSFFSFGWRRCGAGALIAPVTVSCSCDGFLLV